MENPSAEYLSALPSIITMAESRCYREIKVVDMNHTATGALVASTPSVPRPSDLLQPRNIKIREPGTTRWYQLQMKTLEYLQEYAPDNSIEGFPVYYAFNDEEDYVIAPNPDLNYEYELKYKRRPTNLSTTNESNWLSTIGYDALFAACMVESSKFVMDDRKVSIQTMWEPAFKEAVSDLNSNDMMSERDSFRVPDTSVRNG